MRNKTEGLLCVRLDKNPMQKGKEVVGTVKMEISRLNVMLITYLKVLYFGGLGGCLSFWSTRYVHWNTLV